MALSLRLRGVANSIEESFGAVFIFSQKPRMAPRVVAGVIIVHSLLLGYSAWVHSPTRDEPGHLVAGLVNWKFGRFDIYAVNPPLVRLVAALPVLAIDYSEDWTRFYEGPGARPEFRMGDDFLKANGDRALFLITIARWACIPFSWLGAIICFLWARDLYGPLAGILASTIWCFEPNILAHASLITPDAPAAALGIAACYFFWRWLVRPSWTMMAVVGIVLGLAQLTKFTLVIFYVIWPLIWLCYFLSLRTRVPQRAWVTSIIQLVGITSISIYVVNVGYKFEGSFKPLRNVSFVSELLSDKAALKANGDEANTLEESANRFATSQFGGLRIPLPINYIQGIDIQQRDFEHSGRPSFLRGVWRTHGVWYYYLFACAVKIPLGLLLLVVITLVGRSCGVLPGTGNNPSRDEVVLLFPFFAILLVVSSRTEFNEHFRYVLPALPYVFVACSQSINFLQPRRALSSESRHEILSNSAAAVYCGLPDPADACNPDHCRPRMMRLIASSLVVILVAWCITSSWWVYPHSLAYFNEAVGGSRNGRFYLLGSNLDWGQDLKYLLAWSSRHKQANWVFEHDYRPLQFADLVAHELKQGTRMEAQHIDFHVVNINRSEQFRTQLTDGLIREWGDDMEGELITYSIIAHRNSSIP